MKELPGRKKALSPGNSKLLDRVVDVSSARTTHSAVLAGELQGTHSCLEVGVVRLRYLANKIVEESTFVFHLLFSLYFLSSPEQSPNDDHSHS